MNKEWIAAYYPGDLIDNEHTKTIFCLIFDKVIFNFPISHMGCGGGLGISDCYCDDPLVDEGVLELREEFLLDEIEADFSPGHYWGTDEEFGIYHDLNIAGMAMKCSETDNAIPATSRQDAPLPISCFTKLNLNHFAKLQATALAFHSISLTLPAFSTLNSYEILEAREKLKEQLSPFRSAMLALAPKVRSGLSSGATIKEVFLEAKYVAETDVSPRLNELKRKLELERGTFWRKLTYKVLSNLPSIALKGVSSG